MSYFVCPACKNSPAVEKRDNGIVIITCYTCGIASDVAYNVRDAQKAFIKLTGYVSAFDELREWAKQNLNS